MATPNGMFIWYELMTTDVAAARAFYTDVVGWTAQTAPPPNDSYTLFSAGPMPVAGLMEQPEPARQMGAPPMWIGYVLADDIEQTAEKAKGLGAKIYVAAKDIPGVGRISIMADPQNAAIALFKPGSPPMDQPSDPAAAGRIGWHELWTTDWEKALGFYSEMFGWQKSETHDMGPMGKYQLFSMGAHPVGGMFNKPPMVPVSSWLYYFNVGDIDAAAERVKAAGGQVANGPMEVPGGGWIVQAKDPQGAMFALFGKRG